MMREFCINLNYIVFCKLDSKCVFWMVIYSMIYSVFGDNLECVFVETTLVYELNPQFHKIA